jgi:hypothetical protein
MHSVGVAVWTGRLPPSGGVADARWARFEDIALVTMLKPYYGLPFTHTSS